MRFNGKDFADFGVHVDESKAFGSPEKDYELVEIMGRNGNLSIYNDRFKDITLPFPCFIRTGFIEKYRSLLAYLNSQTGYQRLETDKEPNHFRKALFQGIVDPQTTAFNHGGFFTVNLLAHPQRFLKSGEIPVSASSQSVSYTGNPVEIDNPSGISAVNSLAAALEPIQTGTGEPSPTNIRPITGHTSATVTRTGKNLLPSTLADIKSANGGTWNGNKTTINGVTIEVVQDTNGNVTGFKYNGTASGGFSFRTTKQDIRNFPVGNYIYSIQNTINMDGLWVSIYQPQGKAIVAKTQTSVAVSVTEGQLFGGGYIYTNAGNVFNNVFIQPMLRLASVTDATFEPYTSNTYTIDLNGTRYGGSVNLATGVLTLTHQIVDMGTLGWSKSTLANHERFFANSQPSDAKAGGEVLSSAFNGTTYSNLYNHVVDNSIAMHNSASQVEVYSSAMMGKTASEFKTAVAGQTMCYELATPTTVQLTPQQISLLTGINYISSSDEVTVTVSEPSLLENPTLFESKPLIRVYGHGTLTVNNQYVTIAENPYEYIDIDCDIMDCFYGANNANQYVTLPNDYITLHSGNNYIAYDGTVQITPRWYEV